MTLIFIGILIALGVASCWLSAYYKVDYYRVEGFAGIVYGIVAFLLFFFLLILSSLFIQADSKAKVLNATYDTHFTADDALWNASLTQDIVKEKANAEPIKK